MTKNEKILTILILLSLISVTGDYFIRLHVILPEFAELERQEVAKDIARCKKAVEREIRHVEKLATDWAAWDDLYAFAIDGNERFAGSNFQWETLVDTGIHLLYVIDAQQRVVYSGVVNPDSGQMIKLSQLPEDNFPADHPLLRHSADSVSFAGIFITDSGPMMIASHKILNSLGEGPSHGILLLGRFLNDEVIEELGQQTQIDFKVRNHLFTAFSEADIHRVEELVQGKQVNEIVDDRTMTAFGLINDLQGQPSLLISAVLPRHTMERGRTVARFSSLVLLAAVGLVIGGSIVLTLVLIEKSRRRQGEIQELVLQRTDELRLSEERMQALSDASFEAIFLTEDGVCLEQNRAAESMFGYSGKEAIGSHAMMWFAPEDRQKVIRKTLSKEEQPYEINALRKDGRIFPAQIQTREAEYRGRKVRVSAIRDLTLQKQAEKERELMEDKLRRSQKMESIGMMAGGVAHDLNNILSGIVTYPELILMNLAEDSPLYKPIEAIRKSGKSAAAVVDDLLTLARGVSSSRENNSLNAIVKEYIESPEFQNLKSLHNKVSFKIELEQNLLNINCSTIHIKKCVMNLVTNAAEAISTEGEVVVSTCNSYCEASLDGYPDMQQGEYAVLSVADTGTGIPEESIGRIFEPFYSRKVVGRSGTGLGLAVAWNTVQDHNGGISVQSNCSGTTFELYFPATRENPEVVPESININHYRGNGEKILIVDDDIGQRTIAIQLLDMLNYSVRAVESGEQAVHYLRSRSVDLVILDMVMSPGINGCTTYKKILELHPQQKAIITSGYSETSDVQEALAIGVRRFVKKPYLIGTLAAAIHDTLGSS